MRSLIVLESVRGQASRGLVMSARSILLSLGALALCVAAFLALTPRMVQDEAYHMFADQRTIAGVRNFWNVVSNVAFVVAGILGLRISRDWTGRVLFIGVFLTCFGSAYYHLAPSDARLVWDRLPMTLVFMALPVCIIGRRLEPRLSRWLLVSLVAAVLLVQAWFYAHILWWAHSAPASTAFGLTSWFSSAPSLHYFWRCLVRGTPADYGPCWCCTCSPSLPNSTMGRSTRPCHSAGIRGNTCWPRSPPAGFTAGTEHQNSLITSSQLPKDFQVQARLLSGDR